MGTEAAEVCTLAGEKWDGCGSGSPRAAHSRLTIRVMRAILLLAEQINLWEAVRGSVCWRRWKNKPALGGELRDSRDERFPLILPEDSDPAEPLLLSFDLAVEFRIPDRPVGVQGLERCVELEIGREQAPGRVRFEVGEVRFVGRFERIECAVVDTVVCAS